MKKFVRRAVPRCATDMLPLQVPLLAQQLFTLFGEERSVAAPAANLLNHPIIRIEGANDAGSQIAQIYALRKEPEKMYEWLEQAWKTHDAGVTLLLSDPFLRAYRNDPRFIAFAQKIGVMKR